MPTTRLASQVENIDRDSLTASAADAAALLNLTQRMTTSRLKGKTDRETAEDAAQVAALLACTLLADMGGDLTATAALASYRASLAALEDQGTTKEDAADVLATDDDGIPLLRLALPSSPTPDRITRTTDRDRLALAVDLLADEDPGAADLLALSTYLPTDSATDRSWRDGRPSAAPMVAALGMTATGKNRAKVARRIADAFTSGTEAAEAAVHQTATRTRYGATPDVWKAHRAMVEDCQPTDPERGQYGRPRITPRTGPASAVIHQHTDTGDRWLQITPEPTSTLLPVADDLAAYCLAQTDTFTGHSRSTADTLADRWAAAQEPVGPVRKPNSRKRRRDGAVGSPMTSGPTRPRY